MLIETERYQAAYLPPNRWLRQTPAIIEKAERILDAMLHHETLFSDYEKGCEEACGECERCASTKRRIAASLTRPDVLVWEVWRKEPESGELLDFVGILRLSHIRRGCDAIAHYFFFDGTLNDKTALLERWREWVFSDHEDWKALHRVTVEIPDFAFALARHASRSLDFSGEYEYEMGGKTIDVEGVRKDALKWRGRWHDVLIMGLVDG